MGRKHAKIISRDAFAKAFVQAEVVMRHNLHGRLGAEIEKHTDENIIKGLRIAQDIVYISTEPTEEVENES